MVCSNCGTALPDGSRFCAQCGTPVIAKNKREFIQNLAPDKVRKKITYSKFLAILCVVLMLVSYLVVINTSLENIPLIETVAQGDTDVFIDMKDDMDEMADLLEDGLDDKQDELEEMLTKGQIRKVKKFAKAVRKCASTLSISNFNRMVKRFETIAKMNVDEEIWDLSDELSDVQEVKMAIGLASGILFFGALASAVFLFLGGYFQKTVLAILGTIGAFLYCLMGCGVLMLFVVLTVAVAMIFMMKRVNDAYKDHRTTT